MAWIDRGGQRYYRRSVREGAKVRTEYFGAGPLAEGWAEIDAAGRELRQHRRMMAKVDLANLRQDLAEEEQDLDELAGQVRDLARVTLEAAGYHQHDRGPWRKRRTMTDAMAETTIEAAGGGRKPTGTEALEKTLMEVMTRAQAGDERVLPAMQHLLGTFGEHGGPQGTALMLNILGGDPSSVATEALIDRVAGQNLATAYATREWLTRVRKELAGPEPTVLERLLVDRVALCYADASHMDKRADLATAGGTEPGHLDALDKRRSRANKRFLDAAKALAAVRKLALPALQVNIAESQVNIAGPGTSDG